MALLLILQLFFITFMTFFIAAMVHLAGAVGRQGGGDFGTPLEHECGQAITSRIGVSLFFFGSPLDVGKP